MSIAQNYPNVAPQLFIDLANTQRLDQRLTFARASVGTYYDENGVLQTASSGVARLQFDPVTGESLGLLRENQATNLVTYSEQFDNAVWTKTGATITVNAIVAPDGTLTGDIFTSSSADPNIRQSASASPSTEYTTTIYLKVQSGTLNTRIQLFDNTGATLGTSLEITITTEWQRFSITRTTLVGSTAVGLSIGGFGTTPSGTAFSIWGAQLEAGAFPTSYIKTEASQVTRAADTVTLTNTGAYNTAEFTAVSSPFGVSGVSANTVTLNGDVPIERLYVYPRNISQNEINSIVENDGWWNWRIVGSDFALPLFTTDGSIQVDWGDGTVETLTTAVHTFTNASPHTVRFRMGSGTTFEPRINANATHRLKVVAVGSAPSNMIVDCTGLVSTCSNLKSFDATLIGGTDFTNAWLNCTQLTGFPVIDTSSGTQFDLAWQGCTGLTQFPLLDTSSGLDFTAAWSSCNSLTSFPIIDTSSGTNFTRTWLVCSSLTSFPAIDTSSGTNFTSTWSNCTSLTSFPLIDTSSGTGFTSAWQNCTSLTSFPAIDTSSGTGFSDTWNNCNKLTSFPLLDMSLATNLNECWDACTSLTSFPAIDFPVCTNFTEAWRSCSSLTSFPLVDTSAGTLFNNTWNGCSSLTSFPLIDTSSGTNFSVTWFGCSSFTSFPLIDTSAGTTFFQTWTNCTSLTSFPLIDTSAGTDFFQTWENCPNLTSFPLINTSLGTRFERAWRGCTSLTSFSLIDTSSATSFASTWYGCSSLTSFPALNMSSGTNFSTTFRDCSSLTSFPLINMNLGTNFTTCWFGCSSMTDFPANFFDSWTGTPLSNCFYLTWDNCSALTATSVENILVSIDTSGQSPTGGTEITIDYNVATGALTAPTTSAITSLKGKGWTIKINGVLQ